MRGRYLVTAAVSITHMCNEITRTGCQLLECYVVDATSSRPRCHTHNTRLLLQQQQQQRQRQQQQAVGGRPPRYAPAPLLPPWAAKRFAPPSRRQRSSSFPRPTRSIAHRCSRLTRQHGGEQSGLMTLTFDLVALKVVSESRVTWATSVPILVFLGPSVLDLGPMYATDRRQTASSLYARLLGNNNKHEQQQKQITIKQWLMLYPGRSCRID